VGLAVVFIAAGEVELLWAAIWGLHGLLGLSMGAQRTKAKKPLVMTARAKRIFYTGIGLTIVAVALSCGLGLLSGERAAAAAGIATMTVLTIFAGHVVLAANLVLWPLEERSRRRFQAMAEQK